MEKEHNCLKESELAVLSTKNEFLMTEIQEIKQQIKEINNNIKLFLDTANSMYLSKLQAEKEFASKIEFKIVKNIVFWVSWLILTWAIGALLALIYR